VPAATAQVPLAELEGWVLAVRAQEASFLRSTHKEPCRRIKRAG
jgi:hypothetical protein